MQTTNPSPAKTLRRVYALHHGPRFLRDSERRDLTSQELRDYYQTLYRVVVRAFEKLDTLSPEGPSQGPALKKALDELLAIRRLLDEMNRSA